MYKKLKPFLLCYLDTLSDLKIADFLKIKTIIIRCVRSSAKMLMFLIQILYMTIVIYKLWIKYIKIFEEDNTYIIYQHL